jgi:hypothetical protein
MELIVGVPKSLVSSGKFQYLDFSSGAPSSLSDYTGRSENLDVCEQILARLQVHSRSYGPKRS